MKFEKICEQYDSVLAEIIRKNLKANALDIPGTVYFDPELNCMSKYYLANDKRAYYVLIGDENNVVGGIGLDKFDGLEKCAELQKLYLDDSVKGRGLGYKMIYMIMNKAKELGYEQMYLETHHNLQAAIHMYEKCGFKQIERLSSCVHSTMDYFYLRQL